MLSSNLDRYLPKASSIIRTGLPLDTAYRALDRPAA
jgi:hypothetical protein